MVVQGFVGDLSAEQPPVYNPSYPERNIRQDRVYASDGSLLAEIEWLADEAGQVITRTRRTYYDGLGEASWRSKTWTRPGAMPIPSRRPAIETHRARPDCTTSARPPAITPMGAWLR